MWMSQLAKNTTTEDSKIGSHSDGIDTISLPPMDRSPAPGLPETRHEPEYGTRCRFHGVGNSEGRDAPGTAPPSIFAARPTLPQDCSLPNALAPVGQGHAIEVDAAGDPPPVP